MTGMGAERTLTQPTSASALDPKPSFKWGRALAFRDPKADPAYGEDVSYRRHGQAARLAGA